MLNKKFIMDVILTKHNIIFLIPSLILIVLLFAGLLSKKINKTTKYLLPFTFYLIIINIIYITTSIIRKYPWSINTRWDISTHTIFTLSWLFLFIYFLKLLNEIKNSYLLVYMSLLIFLFYTLKKVTTIKYNINDSIYSNLNNIPINGNETILINAGAFPTIKYLFEYGPFKKFKYLPIYKNITVFNHNEYIYATTNENNANKIKYDDYQYIILSHFDHKNSEFYRKLELDTRWKEITTVGPSKIFKKY